MKKLFYLLFLFFLLAIKSFGFEIVYPKTNEYKTTSDTSFFIGSSKKTLKINGENIDLYKTGAFSHFVHLKNGENVFEFKTNDEKKVYKIIKVKNNFNSPKFIKYKKEKSFITKNDNTPLRSTPQNSGINRIVHLQKDILLKIDGEKGDFYRVNLVSKNAWIAKNSVIELPDFTPAIIKGESYNSNDDYYIFTFLVDKKVAYEIIEGDTLKLKFYNTNNDFSFEFPYKNTMKTDKIVGYKGEYIDNKFIFMVKKYPKINKAQPFKNIKIVVDPGHGGSEFGAISGLRQNEKDIVLKISKYLENELALKGANVIMTRDSDIFVPLYERVKIANKNNATIFVSIHNDAVPDSLNPNDYRGMTIYYYYDMAEPLAKSVSNSMDDELKIKNNGIKKGSFAVVRNTNCLSILIEVGFLINPQDAELLENNEFQKKSAKAIADGIENYFK